jgi:hypothetical protein
VRARHLAAIVAAIAGTSFVGAAPAQAGLLGGLGQVVTATTTAATQATGSLLGGAGLPTVTQQLLCPPTSALGGVTAPLGLSAIGEGLTSLSCNAGLLDYQVVTRWRAPDGTEIVRTHAATIGVPKALDVDRDALPDVTATITLTSLNTVGLVIERLPGETSTLPLRAEAVLKDPGTGLLGRDGLAFGFDARDDRAPQRFQIATPIDTILGTAPDFRLDVSQTGRGSRIALVGGLFDGTAVNRVDPSEFRLDYLAAPDAATIRARLADPISVSLSQNRTGRAQLTGRIADGAREDRFEASLVDLPSTLGLTVRPGETLDASYVAAARVAQLRASFEQRRAGGLAQKAVLELDDVPVGLSVRAGGSGGSVTTTGGPVGRTKVGVADGEPRFLPDAAYVALDDDGTVRSTSAQLRGLERASFSLDGAPSLSAKLAPSPLKVSLVEPGRRILGDVADLPGEFDLALDPAGRLTFDGRGRGIERVSLDARSATPLVGRATTLRATVRGIPAQLDARLEGSGLTVGGSGPLREVELVATDGDGVGALPAGTDQAVSYTDTPQRFTLAARVFDLRQVAFDAGALAVTAVTRGGPTSFALETGDLAATGRIEDLPARATLGVGQGDRIRFTGATLGGDPQGIARLTADIRTAPGGLLGRADHLSALVADLPAQVELGITPSDERVEVASTAPIGRIEVAAAAGPISDRAALLPADDLQGVRYVDEDGTYALGARVLGLRRVAARLGDTLGLETETAGGRFVADVRTDGLAATADVRDLPAKATLTADPDARRIGFSGRTAGDEPAGIARLDVALDTDTPLFGRADRLQAHLEGIPADLDLAVDETPDGVGLSASEGIDLVELVAANRAPAPGDLPVGGEQGARLVDLSDADYVLAARVRELREVRVATGSPVRLTATTAGGPFGLRYVTDTLNANARILDLPAKLRAAIDLEAGAISLSGRTADDEPQGIEQVIVDAVSSQPLFGRATNLAARLTRVPADVNLKLAPTDGGARLEADESIDVVELAAADRPVDLDTDVPAGQRIRLTETDDEYLLGARVEQLRLVDAALGDGGAVSLAAKTRGGPFDVAVDTRDLDADVALRDLPADVAIGFDPAAGRITYRGRDGDGEPVVMDRLTASVVAAEPVLGRARRIALDVDDLAPTVTLSLDQDGTGGSVETDRAIPSLVLTASDSTDPVDLDAVLTDPQGAVLQDTDERFLLAVRLLDLQELSFGLAGEGIGLQTRLRPTAFGVDVATGGLTAKARIADLPARADLTVDLARGALRFTGRDGDDRPAGVGLISFEATAPGDAPIFGRATRLGGRIVSVPPTVDVAFDQDAGQVGVTTDGGPVELLEFEATDGADALPDDQGIVFVDRPGEFRLGARLRGLERVTAGLGGIDGSAPIALEARTAGGPFTLEVGTEAFEATGAILDLPAVANLTADLETGAIRFVGSAPIGRLTLDASSDEALFGRADELSADLRGLPEDVAVRLSQTGGRADVTARDAAGDPVQVGSIELAAWSDQRELPADGSQGVVFRDVPGGPFRIGARIERLETLSVDFAEAIALRTRTAGGPFTAAIQTPDFSGDVEIMDLPSELDLGVDLDAGQISYTGSAPIGRITADIESATELLQGAKAFFAEFVGVPRQFTVGLDPEGGDLNLTADAPIDRIELKAGASRESYPAVRGTGAGVFADLSGALRLAARVFRLQAITVDLDPVTLETTMEAGRPFAVDATFVSDGQPVTVSGDINDLPASARIALEEGNGTTIAYAGSAPVGQVKLSASGLTVIDGASTIEADIRGVPTGFRVSVPETGPLAALTVDGGQRIDELRIAAGRGLLARGGDDRIFFRDAGGTQLAGTLSGVRSFSVALDPIRIDLAQDPAINKPIDIDAGLNGGTVGGRISKPSSRTLITLQDTGATRVHYDGAGGLDRLQLRAENVGAIPLIDAAIDAIPTVLDVCFASDLGCVRADDPGPRRPTAAQDGRNYRPAVSVDAVSNSTGFVVLNATVRTEPGAAAISVRNVRFRNLAFDLTTGDSDSVVGLSVPRAAVYVDTNTAPFVIEDVDYDTIQNFGLGTTSSPASAQNRFVWIRGIRRGFLGVPTGIDSTTSGTLNCGGNRRLEISGVNILNLPIIGQAVPLCS